MMRRDIVISILNKVQIFDQEIRASRLVTEKLPDLLKRARFRAGVPWEKPAPAYASRHVVQAGPDHHCYLRFFAPRLLPFVGTPPSTDLAAMRKKSVTKGD